MVRSQATDPPVPRRAGSNATASFLGSIPYEDKPMIQVTELGYISLGVRDLAAWQTFAREVLALEVVDEGETDRCYLRMDYWHHRFILHADGNDDLAYLGFRVAGPEEFVGMQQLLADAGITFRVGARGSERAPRA